jgi:hypothetical protein
MEAAYRCGNPRCGHVLTLQVHHIEWVEDGGGNEPSNLLPLCPNCHASHTAGHIPQEAVRHWKAMVVALNHSFDRESMDLLLLLNDGDWNKMPITTDGVLRFAGLLRARLVQRRGHIVGGKMVGGVISTPYCWLELTERGKLLIVAWLEGDEEKYRQLVSAPSVPAE